MSSTATAIRATSRQHSYRLSPTPSSRSQPKQIPDLLAGHQQSSNLCSRNGGHASQSHMTSAAYHGQGPVTCETNAPSRQTFSSMSAPFERSWSTQRSTQNWQGDYPATYTVQPGQQRSLQYQPSQQLPVQIKQTSSSATSSHASRQATRTSTPTSTCSASGASTSGDSQSMVMHSLQLPSRISPKGGNLADFAAQVTCLFWFESPQALEAAEKIRVTPQERALPRLSANAVPTESFRKWVRTILSTTQVTQNVIILALMFVYRLKMTNPSVRGRPGSEYRLLTVALMLGNKFLDDNTYTNKTWAEVSGISVQEIHVMEVEFLSNMRYALLASSEQWEEWLDKLSCYFIFCDRVTNAPSPAVTAVSSPTLHIPSPTANKSLSPALSPTAYVSGQHQSRTAVVNHGYSPIAFGTNPIPYPPPPAGSAFSPLAPRPDPYATYNRKRSWDEQMVQGVEHPPKRAHLVPAAATASKPAHDVRRLPVPGLTVNTGYQAPIAQPSHGPANYAAPQVSLPPTASTYTLPPLEPGARAMSTVYAPPTTTSYNGGQSMTSQHMVHAPATTATPTAAYPQSTTAYGTPTKRLSPINTLTPVNAYNTSSPLHDYSQQHGGFHTPLSHSPSVYLQQRNSPYKPIRHVRTLLHPQQNYQLPAIPPSQMHYQPIGRRNDQRTGIVPEYLSHDQYGGSSQYDGLSRPTHGVPAQFTHRSGGLYASGRN